MGPVHDTGAMDPVHESGPWTRSKVGIHGPLVHVLSSPLFFTYVSCCVSYLILLIANIKNRKKLQLIQTIWEVMALLTALHFPLETTWSCKQNRKERYWGQQFWQMERDSSVRPTQMTRPVTVDHLQSWSRIFRSDQTEMVRSIWWTNRNFRTFGLNGKRPRTRKWKLAVFFSHSVTPLSTIFWTGVL